jgi:hypothetical protein
MWVLIRFAFAGLVFLTRLLWHRQGVEQASVYADTRRLLYQQRKTEGPPGDRQKVVVKIFWGLEVKTPLVFSLHRETGWDRAIKWLGLGRELQTGDAEFDRSIYVNGDHPALHRLLTEDAKLRADIRVLMARTAARIFSDGRALWVESARLEHASSDDLRTLYRIVGAIRQHGPSPGTRHFDWFLWTAIGLEALVWSLALYGAPALVEVLHSDNVLRHGRMYFDNWALARTGLIAAGAAFVVVFGLALVLMRGSCRGRRVLAECFLVLLLGLPWSGITAVSYFNRSRDTAPAQVHEYLITKKEERTRRSSKPGWWTGHRLWLEPRTAGAPRFAGAYPVRYEEYRTRREGESLLLKVRTGRLGIPWIEHPDRR